MDDAFDLLHQADLAGYPMGMGTSGGTSDQDNMIAVSLECMLTPSSQLSL